MIGRLVEQQHVGLFEQQLGERDAHLPAAGEFLGAAGPIFLAKSESVEHRADLRLDRVAVAIAKLGVDVMEAVGGGGVFGAGGIELAELVVQRFELLLHFAKVGEDAHAFGEDGAAGEREAVLRKIALGDALGLRLMVP